MSRLSFRSISASRRNVAILSLLGLGVSAAAMAADSFTSTGSGNWSTSSKWTPNPGSIGPTGTDIATIASGHSLIYDTLASGSVGGVTLNTGSGSLTLNQPLVVSGTVEVRPGRTLAVGTHSLTASSLVLGSAGSNTASYITRSSGGLVEANTLTIYGNSHTLGALDGFIDVTLNGSSPQLTTASTDNIMGSVQLTRTSAAGPYLHLGADLSLFGDLAIRESHIQENGYDITCDEFSNSGGGTYNSGDFAREGGNLYADTVTFGRAGTMPFRPGDVVFQDINTLQVGSYITWPDLSFSQDPTYYTNLNEGFSLEDETGTFFLGRTSAAYQSELTLNWDTTGNDEFDWAFRWAGDHTAELQAYYDLGQIIIGTTPAGYGSFDPDVNIFYDAGMEFDSTPYTYIAFNAEIDADNDGFLSSDDCDDNNDAIHPDADEVCDSVDNDCDGTVDLGAIDAGTYYADADTDTYGDAGDSVISCDMPTGYVMDDTDCNDADFSINPAAAEVCDFADNDCDGTTDLDAVDASTFYADQDDDGYGISGDSVTTCLQPSGYTADVGDCDDNNDQVNPAASETCNDIDDDCDSVTDEAGALGEMTWYADMDIDGYGDMANSITTCDAPSGYVVDATDCDDFDPTISPSATESCNLVDDDCDGSTDEAGSVGETMYFADMDGDGHGDSAFSVLACFGAPNSSESDDDCDDDDASAYPGADEYCDEVDNDCNGIVDDPNAVDAIIWYRDVDGDGYGGKRRPVLGCEASSHFSLYNNDCSPFNAAIYPGAAEVCDSLDNDCDSAIDEPGSEGQTAWYADNDTDGYGGGSAMYACTQPSGSQSTSDDCNDANNAINPGATESCNSVDDDCDGSIDENGSTMWYADQDDDGYGDPATGEASCTEIPGKIADSSDCDDTEAATYPGAEERCDGEQNDCSQTAWTSANEDGEVWLENAGTWTSQTALWNSGSSGAAVGITLPTAGTLYVCDGTYDVELLADSASNTDVMGVWSNAVLMGDGSAPVVRVIHASANIDLLNLTLSGGFGSGSPTRGGGVRVDVGTVSIEECSITGNAASSGGGLAVIGGTVTVTDSDINDNSALSTATNNGGGGGFYQSGGTLSLIDTAVYDNDAVRDGGGGYVNNGTFSANGSEFTTNYAQYNGGAMRLLGTSTLTGVYIAGNDADLAGGGGIYHTIGALSLVDSLVEANTAAANGGGVYQAVGSLSCSTTGSGTYGFLGNSAVIGGGVYTVSTATFSSSSCDFGTDASTNNAPTDVRQGSGNYNYGNNATFSCSGNSCI